MADHHTDLPLFRWSPPPVEVIPFPTAKRVGHIRRIAERLHNCRTTREADWHWCRTVDSMVRQMEKAGIDADRIKTERAAFRRAVGAELELLTRKRTPRQPDHGGDAA